MDVKERLHELETLYNNDKSTYEYCLNQNEQLKTQTEHLLNELARLAQFETFDRTRSMEQADLRHHYDELLTEYNELRDKCQENQFNYENDTKHLNDENIKLRQENEQLRVANDLLHEEKDQMKESHETILKKRLDEIKYLQNESRDLKFLKEQYNQDRETFEAIDLKKKQLENDLLTMHAVEDRCHDLQTTVERLETEIQLSVSSLNIISIYHIEKQNKNNVYQMKATMRSLIE